MLYTFVTICVFVGVNVFNLHLVMLNLPAFVHRIKRPKTLGHHHHHQNQEIRQVQVLQHSDRPIIADFLARSEPVIIHGMPHDLFEPLRTHYPIPTIDDDDDNRNDTMIIQQHMFPLRLGPLGTEIRRLTGGRRTVYLASMSGTYSAGVAHIDSFASYNFYYVQKGQKEVFIVPHEHTSLFDLQSGIDNVFVAEDDYTHNHHQHRHHHDNADNSDKNSSHYSWLDRLPYYYRFLLNESQVLIFNNAKCVHKFVNQGVPFPGAEQIYTLRLFSTDPDMTALRNDIFHWRQAQEYAHILMHGTLLRQIGDVTGHQLGQQLGYH